MPRPFPRRVLTGPVLEVAPRLLGALLLSDVGGARVTVRISEVEAYSGHGDDPASHAHRGPTPRNRVMFGPAGFAYVYFTYGMHHCVNVVTGTEGAASAVLLRAGAVVAGIDAARSRRPTARRDTDLARGPANLAAALGIDGTLDGCDLLAADSPLRLCPGPEPLDPSAVAAGPRTGITKAVERPWRFWVTGDPTVSPYRAGGRRGSGSATASSGRDPVREDGRP